MRTPAALCEVLALFEQDDRAVLLHVRVAPRHELLFLAELVTVTGVPVPLWFLARRTDEPGDIVAQLDGEAMRGLRENVAPARPTIVVPLRETRPYDAHLDLDRLLRAPEADGWRFVVVEPLGSTPPHASAALGPWAINLDVAGSALAAEVPLSDGLSRALALLERQAHGEAAREYALTAAWARAAGRREIEREATVLADACVRRAIRPLHARRSGSGVRAAVDAARLRRRQG